MEHLKLNQIIWQVVAMIPEGKVATYGQIARICGYPGHARYVGTTLKQLPDDSDLPWHRVINAKGEIAFPVGSDGYQRQRKLLENEGVQFKQNKIKLLDYRWE
ncbi:MAG: cysteine methyltransferase [Methylophaga sp.]|nr:cysteine methyltransferase [Methylophaga sp.]MAY18482.1 cysteine methyltransferase [Methylophaga sp.]MBN45889.1 cysteine methyltransferase [Methylophaga sp.]HAO24006.1 cysteine methyltransferase [Methylophaga sp.]HCD04979.1 cysteine methyltransferase [Methylophaga sp.]